MKPAPFEYHAPESLEEALQRLDSHGWEAKPLAGGQSLVPAMNFRLARPAVLIDLNAINELFHLSPLDNGGLRIGAMTRQRTVERSSQAARYAPLLHKALPSVAHAQIRNRGTIGGSLAHADPAAELPAVMTALGARFLLRRLGSERWVDCGEFYTGLFSTALEPEEILTEIVVPAMPPRSGCAFAEFARRHGDYALAGATALMALDESGRCADLRLVFFGVGEGPVTSPSAATALCGEKPSEILLRDAAQEAADDLDPPSDIHADADYRRHLAQVLGRRVLSEAFKGASSAAAPVNPPSTRGRTR